jgi:hypothetical protein
MENTQNTKVSLYISCHCSSGLLKYICNIILLYIISIGKILKNRGHDKYDVKYDCDNKVEAGVDISRIIPSSFAFRMKAYGKAEYPFVCVPLRHKNKAIGVIGIDTFNAVPKTPAIPHPEPELLSFLETVGK